MKKLGVFFIPCVFNNPLHLSFQVKVITYVAAVEDYIKNNDAVFGNIEGYITESSREHEVVC